MHIAVILRLVPDTSEELELDESGKDIDREWIAYTQNEFDEYALEEALLLKDASPDVTVTAVAFDQDGVDRILQSAVAKGADRAIKIEHELGTAMDSSRLAVAGAQMIASLAPDIVFTGVQAPDDLFGQLAPHLGARLGWQHLSVITHVQPCEGGVDVEQEYGGGRALRLRVPFPAVLGIQSSTNPPRYLSGTRLREVRSQNVVEVLESAAAVPEDSLEVEALGLPESSGRAEFIGGAPEEIAKRLVTILRDKKLLS